MSFGRAVCWGDEDSWILHIRKRKPHAPPQDTREGYPYYGRMAASHTCWSMVGIPLAGILGWGDLGSLNRSRYGTV